jgi:hypothetical protein
MAGFTAIATGVGLAATAGTTTMSFVQAGKQRRLQRQAEEDAAKAMADARRKLELNYYEALGIQKEPYELERQALIAAGAQAIEAGRESERGAAAVAGRVQMAQQEGQAAIRTAMGKELTELEKATAMEESRLRDVGVQLDLEEAAGAQQAAAQAQEAAQKATKEGIQGATSFVKQAVKAIPLYAPAGSSIQREAILKLDPEKAAKLGINQGEIGSMSKDAFKGYMKGLDPAVKNSIMFDSDYLKLIEQLMNPNSFSLYGK